MRVEVIDMEQTKNEAKKVYIKENTFSKQSISI